MENIIKEMLKNNYEEIFKVLNLQAIFMFNNCNNAINLYENKKENYSLLKTFSDWNNFGYKIKKGEHGTLLIGNDGIEKRYFDISQVEDNGNINKKEIKRLFLSDPTNLFFDVNSNGVILGSSLINTNIINDIRDIFEKEYGYNKNDSIILEDLTMFMIYKRFNYYDENKLDFTEENAKNLIIGDIRALNSDIFNKIDIFKVLNDVQAVFRKKCDIILKYGKEHNIVEYRVLDKNKNMFYNENNINNINNKNNEELKGGNHDENTNAIQENTGEEKDILQEGQNGLVDERSNDTIISDKMDNIRPTQGIYGHNDEGSTTIREEHNEFENDINVRISDRSIHNNDERIQQDDELSATRDTRIKRYSNANILGSVRLQELSEGNVNKETTSSNLRQGNTIQRKNTRNSKRANANNEYTLFDYFRDQEWEKKNKENTEGNGYGDNERIAGQTIHSEQMEEIRHLFDNKEERDTEGIQREITRDNEEKSESEQTNNGKDASANNDGGSERESNNDSIDDSIKNQQQNNDTIDKKETENSNITNKEEDIETSSFISNEEKNALIEKDYVNTDYSINTTFSKVKNFENNIEAIKVLKQLEDENRNATKEEQDKLSKYIGWGGLSDYFDKDKVSIENYNLLKDILTEDEYRDAKASTRSAFFTPDYIIKAIYDKVEEFGFKGGNILEPSCGIGKFFANMPKSMKQNSNILGIELDSISARIAKKLYPSINIKNQGYEKTNIKNNTYNLIIGNIPFGDTKLYDREYNKDKLLIHDYFINKSLDKLADGGIMAIISSTGTMDKKDDKARKLFAEKANFIGAIRLPKETFKNIAGTETATDILFFQKDSKNSKLFKQDFIRSDNFYNVRKDKLNTQHLDYIDKKTGENIHFENIQINEYIDKDLYKDYFIGKKAIGDYNTFKEYNYDYNDCFVNMGKLNNLKEQYEEWKKDKTKEKPIFDIEKEKLCYSYMSDIEEDEDYNENYKITVKIGKENEEYFNYQKLTKEEQKKTIEPSKYLITNNKFEVLDSRQLIGYDADKLLANETINDYYKNNTNNIIGNFVADTGQYGRLLLDNSEKDINKIQNSLKNILDTIKCEYKEIEEENEEETNDVEWISSEEYEKQGFENKMKYSYFVYNDRICYKEDKWAYYVKKQSTQNENIMKMCIKLSNITHELLQYEEQNNIEKADILRKELNDTYDDFVKTFNIRLNNKEVKKLMQNDDNIGLLLSLEKGEDIIEQEEKIKKNVLKEPIDFENATLLREDPDGVKVYSVVDKKGIEHIYDTNGAEHIIVSKITGFEFDTKADIFKERVIQHNPEIKNVDTAEKGLIVSLQQRGKVDLEYIHTLTNKDEESIINELKGQIYYDYEDNTYITKDEYLTGNIIAKIKYLDKKVNDNNKIIENNNEKLESLKENYNNEINTKIDEDGYKVRLSKEEIDNEKKKIEMENLSLSNENADISYNLKALNDVKPAKISYEDICINPSSTWLPTKYYEKFINEVMKIDTNSYYDKVSVEYKEIGDDRFKISNKAKENQETKMLYGTNRKKELEILEAVMNNRTIEVKDKVRVVDEKTQKEKEAYVLNREETALANQCANNIKDDFEKWKRNNLTDIQKEEIEEIYNDRFNCFVSRKYDGSNLTFEGMNTKITLGEHQKNVVARMLYGGNTLMAHCVGSGKTFEIATGVMKFKQLGLSNKSMLVVPKPIVEQWQREFLTLYPNAKILVPNENDFTKQNRKRFLNRIATGNYDAIIVSEEQFNKIPLSKERRVRYYNDAIDEYEDYLTMLKEEARTNEDKNKYKYSVKSIEKSIEGLKNKIAELENEENKDNMIDFEKLGIDKLFVDEAHYYKNAYFATKLGRIGGIQNSNTQRTFDMQMKCRYLNEKTDYKGVYFATGTPITNSVVELYTMMKYLQEDKLKDLQLNNLDDFVANFCAISNVLEFDSTGQNFQLKTRISSFTNAPELIRLFKECCDIVNVEDLKDIVLPKVERKLVECPATETQKELNKSFLKRAEEMKHGFDPKIDNHLKLTNDGKLSAIDPRLYDSILPDEEGTKPNKCVENVYNEYVNGATENKTQLIFSDVGVPNPKKDFDLYNDMRKKLIEKGVKADEIAFIGDYDTAQAKTHLQKQVKDGKIRIVIGSTDKLGTGMNVQDKLIAIHHISIPWRPSDIEQREGRIIRQGNTNDKVRIYTYIAPSTFDARSYEILMQKDNFIKQIMKGNEQIRRYDNLDKDNEKLDYADIVSICTGDSRVKEIIQLKQEIKTLERQKDNFTIRQRENKKQLEEIPKEIETAKNIREKVKMDVEKVRKINFETDPFSMKVYGVKIGEEKQFNDKKEAVDRLYNRIFNEEKNIYFRNTMTKVCEYKGFEFNVWYEMTMKKMYFQAKSLETGYMYSNEELGNSEQGFMIRIDNFIKHFDDNLLLMHDNKIANLEKNLKECKEATNLKFDKEDEINDKKKRLDTLEKAIEKEQESEIKENVQEETNSISR